MDMIERRNLTTYTYDEDTANEVVMTIRNSYFREFERLLIRLQQIQEQGSEK